MGRKSLLLPLAFQLGFLVLIINSQQFCGQAKPDVTKTCISIRLPWQRQPVFFCVDKTSFKYRNQCNTRYPTDCESHGNETLLVATPWECCPISTSPGKSEISQPIKINIFILIWCHHFRLMRGRKMLTASV